jgi:hypothetical protein
MTVDQKQLENMNYFNYLGSLITCNADCTREITQRIVMAKAAVNQKKIFFYRKIGLKHKEETNKMPYSELSFLR